MKLKKKGNKLFFLSDTDVPQLSLGLESEIIIDISKEKIKFIGSKTGAELDWVFFVSIENDNGETKLKSDFANFTEFATYFQEEVFFLVKGGGGAVSTWGGITGDINNQADLTARLDLKANLVSPSFTGSPTAPTPLISDNSTKIATTEFVKNAIFNYIQEVTVGGVGAEYTNLQTAYNAGFRKFYVISNTTQTNFLFSENIQIKIKEGVNLGFTPTNSQIFRISSPNITVNVSIEAEGLGAIISSTSAVSNTAFFSQETNSFFDLKLLGNLNFDFSSSTIRLDVINSNSRLTSYYQGNGKLTLRTPNNLACGFIFTNTILTGSLYAEYHSFVGLGTTSGFFSFSGNRNSFIDKIEILGSYIETVNLLNFTVSSTLIVNNILLNPTVATNCVMTLCGNIRALINPTNSSINATISSDNAYLDTINLGAGFLNVSGRNNVKLSNSTVGSITNPTQTTLISNTTVGVKPTNKIADYLSWSWTISRSGFSVNILNSPTPQNFFQYFMNGTTPPTPTLSINDMQLKPVDFVFDATNPLSPILIFPAVDGEVEYTMRISITGTYSGATGTVRVLPFDIQRVSDGSLLGSSKHIKDLNTNTITAEFVELTTRTIGLTDNFSLTGIRLPLIQNTGATLTITAVQFYISARVIKLN